MNMIQTQMSNIFDFFYKLFLETSKVCCTDKLIGLQFFLLKKQYKKIFEHGFFHRKLQKRAAIKQSFERGVRVTIAREAL